MPYEGRHGDWGAVISKHREMLVILERSRARLGALRPAGELAAAWSAYLSARDRQLIRERDVLAAAVARDYDGYVAACRTLREDVRPTAQGAGLRSAQVRWRRLWAWVTLPRYVVGAHRHARSERRAGRTWARTD